MFPFSGDTEWEHLHKLFLVADKSIMLEHISESLFTAKYYDKQWKRVIEYA